MNSELKRLALAGRAMRDAQRLYYSERSQEHLREAKRLEKYFDDCIDWVDRVCEAIDAAEIPPVHRPSTQRRLGA